MIEVSRIEYISITLHSSSASADDPLDSVSYIRDAPWNSLLRGQFVCFVQQLPESFEESASFRQACAALKLFGQFIQLHGDLLKCHRD
jgi:hypothetical protein